MNQQYSESGLTLALEAAKGPASDLMHSKFGLIPEHVEIQTEGITKFQPGMYKEDIGFRDPIHLILNSTLNRPGTFILLELATQHAVGSLDIFYTYGYDVNFLYYPVKAHGIHELTSAYDPLVTGRIMEVLSDPPHLRKVIHEKNLLQRESLNGVVLSFHSHANILERAHIIKQFPTIDTLQGLGISNVIYLIEANAKVGLLGDSKLHEDLTHESHTDTQWYLMDLIKKGFSVTERGILNRVREGTLSLFNSTDR